MKFVSVGGIVSTQGGGGFFWETFGFSCKPPTQNAIGGLCRRSAVISFCYLVRLYCHVLDWKILWLGIFYFILFAWYLMSSMHDLSEHVIRAQCHYW